MKENKIAAFDAEASSQSQGTYVHVSYWSVHDQDTRKSDINPADFDEVWSLAHHDMTGNHPFRAQFLFKKK
jgi:hypothetical protein